MAQVLPLHPMHARRWPQDRRVVQALLWKILPRIVATWDPFEAHWHYRLVQYAVTVRFCNSFAVEVEETWLSGARSRSFPKKSDERALSAGREILAGGRVALRFLQQACMANRNRIPESSPISPGQRLGRRILLLSLSRSHVAVGPTKAFRQQRLSVAGSGCCIRVRTWYVREGPLGLNLRRRCWQVPARHLGSLSALTDRRGYAQGTGMRSQVEATRHTAPQAFSTRSEALRATGMVHPPERRTNPIGRRWRPRKKLVGGSRKASQRWQEKEKGGRATVAKLVRASVLSHGVDRLDAARSLQIPSKRCTDLD